MQKLEKIKNLLVALNIVKQEDPDKGFHDTIGICTNVSITLSEMLYGNNDGISKLDVYHYFDEWMQDNVYRWEHYSGNVKYPVPSLGECSASEAYILWYSKWSGEYGEMRRKLLAWIIAEQEKELDHKVE